jgi:hypothetical protein
MFSSQGRDGPDSQKDDVTASLHQQESVTVNGNPPAAVPTNDSSKVSYWSLPNKNQLAFLCLARLTDPLAATSISVRL